MEILVVVFVTPVGTFSIFFFLRGLLRSNSIWSELSKEGEKGILNNACRKMEKVMLELFNKFEWKIGLRIEN
jgi:hypothetical protein